MATSWSQPALQILRAIIGKNFGQFILRILGVAIVAGIVSFSFRSQIPTDDLPITSNLTLYALINFNIVLLGVFGFLIGRNIIKLIFDRRRGILGSALRSRLVMAFVSLVIVPLAIVFFLASGLLNSAVEGWFSSQIEESVQGSLEVAQQHYTLIKNQNRRKASELSKLVSDLSIDEAINELEQARRSMDLFAVQIVTSDLRVPVQVENAAAVIDDFKTPTLDEGFLKKALFEGQVSDALDEKGGSQFIRSYQPFFFLGKPAVLVSTVRLEADLSDAISRIADSFKEYQGLKLKKTELKTNYMLMLALITVSLLFAAIWSGFYIARSLSVPIQDLAAGLKAVAGGNYQVHLKESRDDELGMLVRSFNQMTQDLRNSRGDAENRRLYLETLLSNLAVGVISLGLSREVRNINQAALNLFGLSDASSVEGKKIDELLDNDSYQAVKPLLEQIESSSAGEHLALERELGIASQGRERKVLCTVGRVIGQGEETFGTVLLFDDVTELNQAQQMTVWREVARRIAHEIKNPLTPIQLSAQRLQRLLGSGDKQTEGAQEAAQTIIENVDSIKRLANEFSKFARMPTADFQTADLNEILSEVVAEYAENHPDCVFQFIKEDKIPVITVDREQIRRVLINLIDNSLDAMSQDSVSGKRIVIETSYDRKEKTASFEVVDNGSGIKKSDRARIFEPYFTTKKKGTGLGLAIVSSIVADHQGEVRVYDNTPKGTKVIVDLPIGVRDTTQRKFATT